MELVGAPAPSPPVLISKVQFHSYRAVSFEVPPHTPDLGVGGFVRPAATCADPGERSARNERPPSARNPRTGFLGSHKPPKRSADHRGPIFDAKTHAKPLRRAKFSVEKSRRRAPEAAEDRFSHRKAPRSAPRALAGSARRRPERAASPRARAGRPTCEETPPLPTRTHPSPVTLGPPLALQPPPPHTV